MGGWGLGNAWSALFTWRRPWSTACGAILYFALFGLIEGAILIAFRANLTLVTPLAWLYVATIALTALFAVVAAIEGMRTRPALRALGRRVTTWEFVGAFLFTVLVGLLGVYVLTRSGLQYGFVFPEPLSAFAIKSFGGLYLSIALATTPLIFLRGLDNYLTYSTAMFGLILFITLAALRFFDRFDFTAFPGQIIYVAAYLVVGAFVVVKVLRHGTGAPALGQGEATAI
jgi:hypothetical protein